MAQRIVCAGGALRGTLSVPGNKSQTHRALMFGALADGPSRIRCGLDAGDTRCTRAAMVACGAQVDNDAEGWVVRPPDRLGEPADVIDCGNSGTTIRLLAGLFAGQPDRFFVLTGDGSLRRRPMGRIIEPLRAMGADIWARDGDRLAPLAIRGRVLAGVHHDLALPSAQLKSALLLAGLRTGISLTQPGESRDHTERMLQALGAPLTTDGTRIELEPVERLSAFDWTISGDPSSAAFWLVAASVTPGSELRLTEVGLNPTRTGVIEVLQAMGADLEITVTALDPEPRGEIVVRHASLRGTRIDGALALRALDELPVLGVAAAFADGTTTIADAAELRVKESDRLARMETGLKAFGIDVEPLPDGMRIEGQPQPQDVATMPRVDGSGDHRIVMAFAVAGHVRGGVVLDGAEEVGSSYPSFFDDLERLSEGTPA
ncbi:MAG: 3-phosphoshikimate 1-carboxyvinyltransferase [Myxococcota bacterium]